jgi:hypothetical protein
MKHKKTFTNNFIFFLIEIESLHIQNTLNN